MLECEIDKELLKQARKAAACLLEHLKARSLKLALSESCTAGFISSLLAEIPGASCVLWGSFVCYTKEAKIALFGFEESELDKYGLVSRETACKMAFSAIQKSGADIAASVTGIAGPHGDGSNVPVGTVWIAIALKNGDIKAQEFYFKGSRNEVRIQAVIAVLKSIQSSAELAFTP